ncbi:hypothetical protein ACFV7Q_36575 [Streptomyces sp. NPDC059851]|uniref:hypothetical protein n=1 Tax=Streptomyces sp. NPDC059851 TaxID=3346971 RepID=UPI0036524E9F
MSDPQGKARKDELNRQREDELKRERKGGPSRQEEEEYEGGQAASPEPDSGKSSRGGRKGDRSAERRHPH